MSTTQPGLDSHTQFSFAGAARWFDFIQHHPAVRSAGVPIVELDLNYPLNPVRSLPALSLLWRSTVSEDV